MIQSNKGINNPFGIKNANPFTPRFIFKHNDGKYYWQVNSKLLMNIDNVKIPWERDGKVYYMTIKEFLEME